MGAGVPEVLAGVLQQPCMSGSSVAAAQGGVSEKHITEQTAQRSGAER